MFWCVRAALDTTRTKTHPGGLVCRDRSSDTEPADPNRGPQGRSDAAARTRTGPEGARRRLPASPEPSAGAAGTGGAQGRSLSTAKRKSHQDIARCPSGSLPCAGLTAFPRLPHRLPTHMIPRRSRGVKQEPRSGPQGPPGGRRRRPGARPAGRARRPPAGSESAAQERGGAPAAERAGQRDGSEAAAAARATARAPADRQRRRATASDQPPSEARRGHRPPHGGRTAREGTPGAPATGPTGRHLAGDPGAAGGPRGPARERARRAEPPQRRVRNKGAGAGSRADTGRAAPSSAGRQPARPRDCRAYRRASARRDGGPPGRGPGPRPARQPTGWQAERRRSRRGALTRSAQRCASLASPAQQCEQRGASRSVAEP